MKLLVLVEQHFHKIKDRYWAEVQCNQDFWQRYLDVYEEVIVCARVSVEKDEYDTSKLIRSDRENVRFINLPNFRGPVGMVKNYSKINKIIKSAISECDCIIFRVPSPISIIAERTIEKSKKPFAIEMVVNPFSAFSKDSITNPLQPIIQRLFIYHTKKICMKANGVAYVTEHELQKNYPCKHMIYPELNNYFTTNYSTINLKKENYIFEEWENDKPEKIMLIHSGTMGDYRKGQDIFINTVSNLRIKGYEVEGVLIGDGELKGEFENLARSLKVKDFIKFTGWKAGFESVQQELLKAHIFMFPTASEGLPRSVIEAMASGLMCVGYAIDGMVELLDNTELVHERTAEAFTESIENIILDWENINFKRRELFNKSLKYNNTDLQKRRKEFYENLKICCK